MKTFLAAGFALLALSRNPVGAQDDPPVDAAFQKKIDRAIEKGVNFLLKKYESLEFGRTDLRSELVLLTLIHGGTSAGHPVVEKAAVEKHFTEGQMQDGGWGYNTPASTGSMTCGGVVSLMIRRRMVGPEPF